MKRYLLSIFLLLSVTILAAQSGNGSKTDFPGISGNEGAFNSMDMRVYPNPVQNMRFTIELSNQNIQEIRLSNIAGSIVFQKKLPLQVNKYNVAIGNLPNGVYLLKVTTDSNTRTTKLLVRNP